MNTRPAFIDRLEKTPRKIAIFRASRIGDFICATPAFRAIRREFPSAEISLVALPIVKQLAERSPHIDRFIAFPGFPGIAEQLYDPACAAKFLEHMRNEKFDLVIQMHGSGRFSNPIALQFYGRHTVGFVNDISGAPELDAAFPYIPNENEITRLLQFLRFLGIQNRGNETEFFLTQSDHETAERWLKGAKEPLIGMHPSAREATKRWHIGRFVVTARSLLDECGGQVVLVGDEEAASDCALIGKMLGEDTILMAGQTSLAVLGAVLSRLTLFISNDSGPAHIAYALRVPSVTIFGGTDPFAWSPPDQMLNKSVLHPVDCRPCDYNECPIGNLCLVSVDPDDVLRAARSLLAARNQSGCPMD
jgi:ADP-heptose:LPS heptosyltransferase